MIRFALFAFALFAASAQAQVYKCLDANGRTVYRQDPCPPSMTRETMQKGGIPPAPAAAPAAPADKAAKGDAKAAPGAPKSVADQEQAFRKRQQDAAKAAKEADQQNAEVQRKASNCNNAKQRLAQYEIGGRITKIDAQGERYYMDDAAIESEKAKARADVSQFCGG